MADSWIKMRTDLYRDPKVCVMADMLMDDSGDLARYVDQHCQRSMTVTRNVMRNVTVGALVSVWGVMRVRGKCEGTDLVCRGITISVLDDIADLPGFGNAMEAVGWAFEKDGSLVFPRFFEDHNVDPEESSKKKNAERQRRFRERQKQESDVISNVTRNVTVTHREEKSREENISSSTKKNSAPRFDAVAYLLSFGVDEKTIVDWLEVRRSKKLRATQTAMEGVVDEAKKAGVSVQKAIEMCCKRGWGGFDSSWLPKTNSPPGWHDQNAETIAALTGRSRDHEPDDRTIDV